MFSFELDDPSSARTQPIKEEPEPAPNQTDAAPPPPPNTEAPTSVVQANGKSPVGDEVRSDGQKENPSGLAESVRFVALTVTFPSSVHGSHGVFLLSVSFSLASCSLCM